jgi:cobalamin-dependent methionine synthase I
VNDENHDRRTHWTIDALKEHFEELRATDLEAIKLAHSDLSRRLEGFPQQFATKEEMDTAAAAVQRLDRDTIAREIYETNHKALADLVQKLDREKMSESVFQTFVENYRLEQEAAATERRAVASALAASSAREGGQSATWAQIGVVLASVVGLLSFVVILANYFLR